MAHTVFLNASPFPEMPNGAAGEWQRFWSTDGSELEASSTPPLLWWCLFCRDDLRHASFLAEEDAGTEEAELLLLNYDDRREDYPYLVTTQKDGLQRLRRRRAAIVTMIGDEHATTYDAFVMLVKKCFGPHILLRTSDMAEIAEATPWFLRTLAELDGVELGSAPGPELSAMVGRLHTTNKDDQVIVLSGAGPIDVWPQSTTMAARPPVEPGTVDQNPQSGKIIESMLDWAAALLAAGSGIAAYLISSSFIAGAVALAVVGTGLAIALVRRR